MIYRVSLAVPPSGRYARGPVRLYLTFDEHGRASWVMGPQRAWVTNSKEVALAAADRQPFACGIEEESHLAAEAQPAGDHGLDR